MELSDLQKEILSGSMLGDGSLIMHKGGKNPYYQVLRKLSDIDYLKWEFEHFKDICNYDNLKIGSYLDKRTGNEYHKCYFRTKSLKELMPEYLRWYRCGKKDVPDDLILTPLTIAIWLADDGYVNIYKKSEYKNKLHQPKSIHIKFATHSFSLRSVEILRDKLTDIYGNGFLIYKENNVQQYTIRCHDKASRSLLRGIDDYFPPLFRKSDIWRNCPMSIYSKLPDCAYCGSEDVNLNGKDRSGVQRYKCKACGKNYIENYKRSKKGLGGKLISND